MEYGSDNPEAQACACAESPSKAEPTGSSGETRLEYRVLPRKSPVLPPLRTIQISGAESDRWVQEQSQDAVTQSTGPCIVTSNVPW